MQHMLNKIQRGFSESAKNYDLYTGLHREIADRLFLQVAREPDPSALLDVGCGTGYLTIRLREHFTQSKIIGLDFSPGMLEAAASKHKGVDWILADVNKMPFTDGTFTILVSNLTYQWAGDLTGAFTQARRVLVPNGVLAFTLFGYNTCQELFQSLDEATAKALQFNRLPDGSKVRQALEKSGFKNFKVDIERIKIEFNSMRELMDWLKSIGANNLLREGYLGPEALSRAASIYHERFPYLKGVGATFEVIRAYVKR
jgi:malonyl-CoA O-methyltransferase